RDVIGFIGAVPKTKIARPPLRQKLLAPVLLSENHSIEPAFERHDLDLELIINRRISTPGLRDFSDIIAKLVNGFAKIIFTKWFAIGGGAIDHFCDARSKVGAACFHGQFGNARAEALKLFEHLVK